MTRSTTRKIFYTLSTLTLTIGSFGFLSIFGNLEAQAAAPKFVSGDTVTVIASKSLNIRNNKCEKIGEAINNSSAKVISDKNLTCKIQGKNYTMINVSVGNKEGFVAQNWIINPQADLEVSVKDGLNLRNEKCERIAGLNFKTQGTKLSNKTIECTISNTKLKLIQVKFGNREGYAVERFLQKI